MGSQAPEQFPLTPSQVKSAQLAEAERIVKAKDEIITGLKNDLRTALRHRDNAEALAATRTNVNKGITENLDHARAQLTEQVAIIDSLTAEMTATNYHDSRLVADLRAKIDEQGSDINRLQAIARNESGTERNQLLARIAVLECELRDANHRADHWLKECHEWRASAEATTPTPASAPDTATVEALRAQLERAELDRDRADYETQKWADRAHSAEYKLKTMPTSETALDNADTISRIADMVIVAFMDRATLNPEDLRDVLFTRRPEARANDAHNVQAHNADTEKGE